MNEKKVKVKGKRINECINERKWRWKVKGERMNEWMKGSIGERMNEWIYNRKYRWKVKGWINGIKGSIGERWKDEGMDE